ncbi:hypothetical protein GN956_G25092 [Arapaima gigas]
MCSHTEAMACMVETKQRSERGGRTSSVPDNNGAKCEEEAGGRALRVGRAVGWQGVSSWFPRLLFSGPELPTRPG